MCEGRQGRVWGGVCRCVKEEGRKKMWCVVAGETRGSGAQADKEGHENGR